MLEHDIWWQVYPLGALGAPIRGDHGAPAHRLRDLDAWLDYVVELGCNGILLNPIFESVSHGYDTLDHYKIDGRLGDDADFDHLIAECRARGLQVILDGVFNHVARTHPMVTEQPGLVAFDGGRPRAWEGHDSLVELDHANPLVVDLVADIMLHWLRRGISGWRLDVAYAVPAAFWRDVTATVRGEFPEAIFIGEVIHGDYARFIEESTLTTLTQYELWKGIWSSLKEENLWELAHAIVRHNDFCRGFTPQTFIGNHDVTRIATLVGPELARIAVYILMSLPGVPSVYYGDEQGFAGTKREQSGGDDEVRPALPATPAEFSRLGAATYADYRGAIAFRRRHPWLAGAEVEVLHKDNLCLLYRVTAGDRWCEVRVDLAHPSISVVADDEATGTR
ncbi:Glycosidase [Tessaracoccus bendigoensis DSM 12906]|uniref:Glycosidase n=1 Tax=Tessaracoccus bendigoensis DSM 12906 TaxID=1123357 RepID=A0A1M6DMK2_9ACTN|nr:alpha-amylase family protein [Tessaracoccus bendigoensis]SHI74309.1 Glycosidase [Tessaracoccus bendigoensis DSM 12906]